MPEWQHCTCGTSSRSIFGRGLVSAVFTCGPGPCWNTAPHQAREESPPQQRHSRSSAETICPVRPAAEPLQLQSPRHVAAGSSVRTHQFAASQLCTLHQRNPLQTFRQGSIRS